MTTTIISNRRWRGGLADVALLLGAVFLAPLAIIAIGAPIALLVRVVIEIGRRVW